MLAPAEEVKDEDEDHQNGESSPDGNGNHVVGNLVSVATLGQAEFVRFDVRLDRQIVSSDGSVKRPRQKEVHFVVAAPRIFGTRCDGTNAPFVALRSDLVSTSLMKDEIDRAEFPRLVRRSGNRSFFGEDENQLVIAEGQNQLVRSTFDGGDFSVVSEIKLGFVVQGDSGPNFEHGDGVVVFLQAVCVDRRLCRQRGDGGRSGWLWLSCS